MAEFTEDHVAALAPVESALGDARGLLRKSAFRGFARSADGVLVFAECKGSAKEPYKVSLDFASSKVAPSMRCNCPSRQRPCKHALALALAFAQRGSAFPVGQPPADLIEKSEKLKERREKQSTVEEKPRKVNEAALARKTSQQLDALVSLEKLIIDVATTGLGGLKSEGVEGLIDQANRLGDSQLQGARERLIRLASLLQAHRDELDEEDLPLLRSPLSDEDRHARLADALIQLWAVLRRGQRMLDGKAEEGDSRSESDAQLEALLGRAWKLSELKEAGYWVTGRSLLELAHERHEDPSLERISAEGYLLDLDDGSIFVEWTALPFAAARRPDTRLRPSRLGVLQLREAALYPGELVNRRIRWNDRDEAVLSERSRSAEDIRRLHAMARPVDAAIKALREQLKNPLAPMQAVFLLDARRFGQSLWGDQRLTAMEDGAGQRLLFRDPPDASFPTSLNLAHAAAAFGPGSVATRLWYDPVARGIFGQALALFAGERHLRLGT
ncbi:MAG: SWIM zinc finger family protein [Polyangiaceae bacterium]|jgi:hypothetical protein|nr:SWIM zinc finger family protein [Polyangiaceae bacterium]